MTGWRALALDNCPNLPVVTSLPWNNLDATPHMGWNSFYPQINTEAGVKAQADALVSTGLAAKGYVYVNLDDSWAATMRDSMGNIQPNASLYPDGIAALATYVHGDGLKFGIYTGPGLTTCNNVMASGTHESMDASTFAGWGVDLLKYDECSAQSQLYSNCVSTYEQPMYQLMGQDLQALSRPIVYIGGNPSSTPKPWLFAPAAGLNAFRVANDLSPGFGNFCCGANGPVEVIAGLSGAYQSKGHYVDPDYLLGGKTGGGSTLFTDAQGKLQFTMVAMWSSPMILGVDITRLTAGELAVYGNSEVIAIDQDSALALATRVSSTACGTGSCQIWTKPLSSGSHAIALFNTDSSSQSMTYNFGLSYSTRDVWGASNLGVMSSYTASVPSFGVVLLRLDPVTQPTVQGSNFTLENGTFQ